MAVVAVFSSIWQKGVYLIGHDPYSDQGFMVTVKFGIYAETSRIQSIGHARDKYGPFWGMSGIEYAAVDGTWVEEDHPLIDGHVLEFHRPR